MLRLVYSAPSCRRVAYHLVISACAALTTGCVDLRPPVPETAYRAMVSVAASPTAADAAAVQLEFVEFYQEGKWRRESDADGQTDVLIDRPDLRVTWVLDSESKSFDEHRISSVDAPMLEIINPFGPRARSKADFEPLGPETLVGIETQKYAVRGKRVSGLAWVRTDRIPLRFRGTVDLGEGPVEIEIEYSEIKKGLQPGWLFAIPPNFAGYEDRKQPEVVKIGADGEDVRRAKESLGVDQMQGPTPPTF